MYAVIEINGFQYKVRENEKIRVSKLNYSDNESFEIDKVLLILNDNEPILGKPYVEGAKVVCKKIGDLKGKKIEVMKFKRRKNYKRLKGHRQDYSLLQIEKIISP